AAQGDGARAGGGGGDGAAAAGGAGEVERSGVGLDPVVPATSADRQRAGERVVAADVLDRVTQAVAAGEGNGVGQRDVADQFEPPRRAVSGGAGADRAGAERVARGGPERGGTLADGVDRGPA